MLPELLRIGPLSFGAFLLASLGILGLASLLRMLLRRRYPATAKDILPYTLVLVAALFVLTLTGRSFPLRTYGLMVATGFVAGTAVAAAVGRRRGLDPRAFPDLGVTLLLWGIVGTRVFYILFYNLDYYLANPLEMFAIWKGGQVLYGGILFGAVAALLWLRRRRLPALPLLDPVMVGVLVGIGFGRIGCLAAGCCYGRPYEGFLSLRFPPDSVAYLEHLEQGLISPDAPTSLGCWPSQIFASVFAFTAAGLLLLLEKPLRQRPGLLLATGLVLYGCGRFVEEMFRVNPRLGPFSVAQWTSFVVVACGLVVALSRLTPRRG